MQSSKILVAEDFEDLRRFLLSVLQRRPEFHVTEASNGLEAVQKARELQPDLLLLDIGLPRLNGLDVARRVRQLAPATKVLVLSQESSPDVVQEALSLGTGYVHKPRIQRDLLPAIDAVLKGERFVSRELGLNGRTAAAQRHDVQFYSDDSIFLESFARFIGTALRVGNPAIVIATESHREGLVHRLKEECFDIAGAIKQGTYISLDVSGLLSTTMVDDAPDLARFSEGIRGLIETAARATQREHARVALCAECGGVLCSEGKMNAAIRLEQIGNDLIETCNVDILCAYALGHFRDQEDDPAFRSLCEAHTTVDSR